MSPARCHLLTVGMVVPSRAAVSAAVRYPAAPQPDAVAGDAAVAAHGGEAAGGVGASPAAGDAALAEDDRDLVELVLIQQADRVDGGLGGGVGFPGGQRVRDGRVRSWPPGSRTCAVIVSPSLSRVTSVMSSRMSRLRSLGWPPSRWSPDP